MVYSSKSSTFVLVANVLSSSHHFEYNSRWFIFLKKNSKLLHCMFFYQFRWKFNMKSLRAASLKQNKFKSKKSPEAVTSFFWRCHKHGLHWKGCTGASSYQAFPRCSMVRLAFWAKFIGRDLTSWRLVRPSWLTPQLFISTEIALIRDDS